MRSGHKILSAFAVLIFCVTSLGTLSVMAEGGVSHAAQEEAKDDELQEEIKRARLRTAEDLSDEDAEVLKALKDAGYFDREKYQNVEDLPVNEYSPIEIESFK